MNYVITAKGIKAINGRSFVIHPPTGKTPENQTKLILGSTVTDGIKPAMHRQVNMLLNQDDIDAIVYALLRRRDTRERIEVMLESINQALKDDVGPEGLEHLMQTALDMMDYGHKICRVAGCKHRTHPDNILPVTA